MRSGGYSLCDFKAHGAEGHAAKQDAWQQGRQQTTPTNGAASPDDAETVIGTRIRAIRWERQESHRVAIAPHPLRCGATRPF